MGDEISEFKSKNGNANFTPKDRMMYLVNKQDKESDKRQKFEGFVREKFEVGAGKIGKNTVRSKLNQKLVFSTGGLLVVLVGWIVRANFF